MCQWALNLCLLFVHCLLIQCSFVVLFQAEFPGFNVHEIRHLEKQLSALRILQAELKKSDTLVSCSKSQKRRNNGAVQSTTISEPANAPEVSLPVSPVAAPKPSLKGSIKVRLLLSSHRPLTTLLSSSFRKKASSSISLKGKTAEKHSKWKYMTASHKKRPASSSEESGSSLDSEDSDSNVSTTSSSGTKYCLATEKTVQQRVRTKVVIPVQKQQSSVAARAKQLLTKARSRDSRTDAEEKPAVARAPRWHGQVRLPEQSSRSSRKITLNKRFLDDSYSTFSQVKKAKLDENDLPSSNAVQTPEQPDMAPVEKAPIELPAPRKIGLFEQPLICTTKRQPKPLQKLIAKWSEDYDSHNARARTHDNKCDKLNAGKLESVENLRPLTLTAVHSRKASVDKAKRFLTRVGTAASRASAKDVKDGKSADPSEENTFNKVLVKPVHSSETQIPSTKSCKICRSTVRVQRHFLCKVPVCRACMRFYRKYCERYEDGDTGDYVCKFEGKFHVLLDEIGTEFH
jgi:hypothetical protein